MKNSEKDKEKEASRKTQEKAAEKKAETPKNTEKKEESAKNEPPKKETPSPEAEQKSGETPEQKIASLEKALLELEDKRIRLIAEMDNQRKRAAKDMEALRYSVMTDTLHPFFQVFDHFAMAVAATESSNNLKALLDGMKMIQTEFDRAFSDLGIERIDAVGKEFDPNTQEAVSQEPSDTVPAGKVIRQWCYGYKLRDRLLKPASVVVSSGPADAGKK